MTNPRYASTDVMRSFPACGAAAIGDANGPRWASADGDCTGAAGGARVVIWMSIRQSASGINPERLRRHLSRLEINRTYPRPPLEKRAFARDRQGQPAP